MDALDAVIESVANGTVIFDPGFIPQGQQSSSVDMLEHTGPPPDAAMQQQAKDAPPRPAVKAAKRPLIHAGSDTEHEEDNYDFIQEQDAKITDMNNTISSLYAALEATKEENISLKLLLADQALEIQRLSATVATSAPLNKADSRSAKPTSHAPAIIPVNRNTNAATTASSTKVVNWSEFPPLPAPADTQSDEPWQVQQRRKKKTPAAVAPTATTLRAAPKKIEMRIPTVDIHTVLVSPKQENTIRLTDVQVKTFVNVLATVLHGKSSPIKPLKVRALNKGGLAIDTASKTEQTALATILTSAVECQDYTVRTVPKLNPRLCIEGIRNEFIPDDVAGSLIKSNPGTFGLSPPIEDLRHVITRTNSRSPTSIIIIEVSPAIRAKILTTKSLKLGWAEGTVTDNLYIRQCQNCFAFGHLKNTCPIDQKAACGNCGAAHRTFECPTRNTPGVAKACVLCTGHPLFDSSAQTHGASESSKCPSYRALARKIQNNIQYV